MIIIGPKVQCNLRMRQMELWLKRRYNYDDFWSAAVLHASRCPSECGKMFFAYNFHAKELSMTAKGNGDAFLSSALRSSSCANKITFGSRALLEFHLSLCFGDSFMSHHHLYADERRPPQLSVWIAFLWRKKRKCLAKASAAKLNNFSEILNKPKKIRKTAILYSGKKVEKSERGSSSSRNFAEEIHAPR